MKCKALFFTLVFPAFLCAQNLVPNWSFEEYEECPDGMAQIDKASGWMSFRISPDYFNTCASPGSVGVPENVMTTSQMALHGNGYSGFGQLFMPSQNSELLGIELLSPLEIGQTYYLSFFVIRGTPSTSNCWANNLGAQLSTQAYSDWPWEVTMPISNAPHVYTEEMITDTVNWTKIEGYFIADSAYQYLAIGNHFSPDLIDAECLGEFSNYQAYYFVDCVCLAQNENMCSNCPVTTSYNSPQPKANTIAVFPNPFTSSFTISISMENDIQKQVKLFGMDGRLIYKELTTKNELVVNNLEQLGKGLYFLIVETKNGGNQNFKLIKI